MGMIIYSARQIFAYGILSTFLVFVLFYGFADTLSRVDFMAGSSRNWGTFDSIEIQKAKISYPDLSQYKPLRTLTPAEFPLDNPTKRILIVGDIHGMITSLEKLLKKVEYSPSKDVLFHVGDIVSKSSLTGSLAVLQFMASNNITGVRGNHDQLVIEWRSWYNWVSTCSGGKDWLDNLQSRWEKAQSSDPDVNLESWLKKQKKASTRKDKAWWRLIPKGWTILDDHYYVAKDMSDLDFQYLLDLPLRLYIPSAHTFIVHAGLLPCDPRYPVDDKARQPLARMPTLTRQPAEDENSANDTNVEDGNVNSTFSKTIDVLRNLQETGILTQVPQNTDPWVVLNMRNVLPNGKITRQPHQGMSWSKIWKQHMESCVGYTRRHSTRQNADFDDATHASTADDVGSLGVQRYNLMCYPSTTVYGHAAARGLDAKRWSFGLDSGCVYGKKLSALVINGRANTSRGVTPTRNSAESRIDENATALEESAHEDEDEDESEDDLPGDTSASNSKTKNKNKNLWLPFGDSHRAKVIAVRCKA